tara:strand:- start:1259 stop:2107 length:849 start_codon:yes stop_codon:yes gene_type:complete
MDIWIKNTDTVEHKYAGQYIQPSEYYLIESIELSKWQNSSFLLDDIANDIAVVARDNSGNNDITDLNDAINYLKGIDAKDKDDSGREVTRQAATDKGWAYLAHPIEFTTSKLNSIYSKNWKGEDRDTCSVEFFDANYIKLTDQSTIDSDCVETRLTIKLGIDYDIVSGKLEQIDAPNDGNGNLLDVRMYVLIGIFDQNNNPFDPDGPGTAWSEQVTEFVGGINLKFFSNNQEVETDGRAGKKLFKIVNDLIPFDQNQIQFRIKHPAGLKHDLMPILEYFRKP